MLLATLPLILAPMLSYLFTPMIIPITATVAAGRRKRNALFDEFNITSKYFDIAKTLSQNNSSEPPKKQDQQNHFSQGQFNSLGNKSVLLNSQNWDSFDKIKEAQVTTLYF